MTIDRKEAVRTFRLIAKLLEVSGGNPHRVRAFANAGRIVERLEGDLAEMVDSGEIVAVRGIGRGTAAVLAELAAGGEPAVLHELLAEIPEGVRELLAVSGLGSKRVRTLWRDLGIRSPGELEYACLENRLVDLPGFGPKSQSGVLEAVRFRLRARQRRLLHEATAAAAELAETLRSCDQVKRVEVAGDVRRGCETVSDLELIAVMSSTSGVDGFLRDNLPAVARDGEGVWTGRDREGLGFRVTVTVPEELGARLLWATGNGRHLELLQRRAAAAGMRLAANGLWRGDRRLEGACEDRVYAALGCQPVPCELREGEDEVDLAARGELPVLVAAEDLRGALHNHTTDSDGSATVEEMAAAAAHLGWDFLGIADHSPAAVYANGVDGERLRDQWRRVEAVNATAAVRVVRGLEADILPDGSLDIPEGCGPDLEYVVASVHSSFRLAEEQQTERIVRAVRHPECKVLGHPTGRLLLARPAYAVDLGQVLEACAERGVAVEINASPYRLDLDWSWARRALALGVQLIINPDAHSVEGLGAVRWGLVVARKAGARPQDVVNAQDIDRFLRER